MLASLGLPVRHSFFPTPGRGSDQKQAAMVDKIKRVVSKLQPNSGQQKHDEKDLRHTVLVVRNKTIKWLRKSATTKLSIIDEILEASNVIEETTLMRNKINHLEKYYKSSLAQYYFEEGSGYSHTPRIPNQTNTFKN